MIRDFSEEKKQEIFRILDEIDMKEWKPFMEWCGSKAEEFGDWPEKLGISKYTRYVDEYQQSILDLNESARQQLNTVFENVAEIDKRYAEQMRECQEELKEQIAMLHKMTEFMQSLADGGTNIDVITKGNANEGGHAAEERKKENKEMGFSGHGGEETREVMPGQETGFVTAGAVTLLEADIEGVRPVIQDVQEVSDTVEDNDDLAVLEKYVNEEVLTEVLGWDVEVLKTEYGDNFVEDLRMGMLEGGIVDEASILYFLATIGVESGTIADGKEIFLEQRSGSEYDGLLYKENTRGAGPMQVTGGTQAEFIKYLMAHTEDEEEWRRLEQYSIHFEAKPVTITVDGEDKVEYEYNNQYKWEGLSVAEYIAKYYPIESAVWFWSYNTQNFQANGEAISINECIERYHGEVSATTELLAVTCAVNGSEFIARGRCRFFHSENTVEILNDKIVLTFVDKTDDMVGTPAYEDNYLYTDDDGYRVYEMTSFIPNGWGERLNLYEELKEFFREVSGGLE